MYTVYWAVNPVSSETWDVHIEKLVVAMLWNAIRRCFMLGCFPWVFPALSSIFAEVAMMMSDIKSET